jgi:hypothetical protein
MGNPPSPGRVARLFFIEAEVESGELIFLTGFLPLAARQEELVGPQAGKALLG